MTDGKGVLKGNEKQEIKFERVVFHHYFGRPNHSLSNLLYFVNPALDNLVAGNLLGGIEVLLGLYMVKMGRRVAFGNKWARRFKKLGAYLILGNLVFCGGSQIVTNRVFGEDMFIAADARRQRIKLLQENKPVSWWFGPKDYEYMSRLEIKFMFNNIKLQSMTFLRAEALNILLSGAVLSHESNEYFKSTLVPDLRKKAPLAIKTVEKPDLKIADLDLEDLDSIWFGPLDPWQELWQEVNLSINFVPKWNFIQDSDFSSGPPSDPPSPSASPSASPSPSVHS